MLIISISISILLLVCIISLIISSEKEINNRLKRNNPIKIIILNEKFGKKQELFDYMRNLGLILQRHELDEIISICKEIIAESPANKIDPTLLFAYLIAKHYKLLRRDKLEEIIAICERIN